MYGPGRSAVDVVKVRTTSNLSAHSQEIQDVQKAISRLRTRVDALEKEREELLYMIEEMNSMLWRTQEPPELGVGKTSSAPHISWIPAEVLRQIFIWCLPSEGEAVMDPNEAPLLFGRISAGWRKLAWSSPELWDTLQVTIPALDYDPVMYEPAKWHNYLLAISGWLGRSNTRPLFLAVVDENTLGWPVGKTDPRSGLIAEILKSLSSQSARWKSLRLHLSGTLPVLPTLPSDLPILEMFSYKPPSLDSDVTLSDVDTQFLFPVYPMPTVIPPVAFRNHHPIVALPRLRYLSLDSPWLLGDSDEAARGIDKFQWHNLVTLRLGHATPRCHCTLPPLTASRILAYLSELGSPLENCHMVITTHRGNAGNGVASSHIALGSLKYLVITHARAPSHASHSQANSDDSALQSFFQALFVPSLTSFAYTAMAPFSHLPFAPLLENAAELKKLSLFLEGQWSRIQSALPNSCLRLKEIDLSEKLSSSLVQCPHIHLPRLQTLRLDNSPPQTRESIYRRVNTNNSNFSGIPRQLGVQLDGPSQELFGAPDWDLVLRRKIERGRYTSLTERITLIETWSQRSLGMPLKEVEFRLNERLREKALDRLAPLVDRGLRVVFKQDFYDLPPP